MKQNQAVTLTPRVFTTALGLGFTKGPAPCPAPATYLLPLRPELVHGDGAVGVAGADPDVVALDHLLHLVLDGHDGLPLAVCLRQRGLELLVGSDQALTGDTRGETDLTYANLTALHIPTCLCIKASVTTQASGEKQVLDVLQKLFCAQKSSSLKWNQRYQDDYFIAGYKYKVSKNQYFLF